MLHSGVGLYINNIINYGINNGINNIINYGMMIIINSKSSTNIKNKNLVYYYKNKRIKIRAYLPLQRLHGHIASKNDRTAFL